MKRLFTYMTMGLLLLCTACNNDSDMSDATPSRQTMTVIPYYSSFLEVNKIPTRSLPDGYKSFSETSPTNTPNLTSIGLILTPGKTTIEMNTIRYLNGKWTGSLDITNEQQYYVYGFMPSEYAAGARAEMLSGESSFAAGANLKIDGLSTLTPADVCVVVGVKKGTSAVPIEDVGIQLGKFDYVGSATDNYVYLLLKHIYAGLHFKAHIDEEYAKLRTIKVKKMTLTTREKIHTRINLTVPLTANNTGADPMGTVLYEGVGTEEEKDYATIQLFPYDGSGEDYELPVATPQDFLSCFVPGSCNQFNLTTTYDVYDKKGNKIREDCEAVNQINTAAFYGINALLAGEIYTVDLKVQPTYLYVLSEPDLDNPTFVIE